MLPRPAVKQNLFCLGKFFCLRVLSTQLSFVPVWGTGSTYETLLLRKNEWPLKQRLGKNVEAVGCFDAFAEGVKTELHALLIDYPQAETEIAVTKLSASTEIAFGEKCCKKLLSKNNCINRFLFYPKVAFMEKMTSTKFPRQNLARDTTEKDVVSGQ